MNIRQFGIITVTGTCTIIAVIALAGRSAQALTMKECSDKYKAAKAAGTLKGMTWNQFRKSECGSDASTAPASTTAPAPSATPTAAPPAATKPPTQPKPTTSRMPSPPSAPAATSAAVFPTAISPKYSSESAGRARMHTCLDQYNANKATNANGGMKWIERGGGYYSECNKRLKG